MDRDNIFTDSSPLPKCNMSSSVISSDIALLIFILHLGNGEVSINNTSNIYFCACNAYFGTLPFGLNKLRNFDS